VPRGSLYEVTSEAWRHGWDLKIFGYIDLTRCILPRMTARKSGVIVNIIGMAGERPEPKYIATCCGNAALIMFTQCLGGESMRDGVRIVGINPGPIMSDRHRRGAERVAEQELGSKERWPELYKRFPIGRPGAWTRSRMWWRFWRRTSPPTSAARSSVSTPALKCAIPSIDGISGAKADSAGQAQPQSDPYDTIRSWNFRRQSGVGLHHWNAPTTGRAQES
jgi:NAD(P)-dependent dehydrogenase (short-subunit alcohol dehydrogenase family)